MARTTIVHVLWSISVLFASASHVYHIPSVVSNRSSTAHFTSAASGLDAPKIHPVNSSSFDWWYFDVVSSDPSSLASVVVAFYTTTANAFPFLAPSDTVTVAQIAVSFPNGTTFGATVNADGATVTSDENLSSGDWHNSGFKWTHTGDSTYTVVVDAPDIGVKGTISFHSVAPAHYPCGPAVAGQNMEVGPGIGWANAVPDAAAAVKLTVGGTKLVFKGLGYHDKNWGNELFTTNIAVWYWGHGRLGPYSIVWFDFFALDGREYVSSYAAKDGRIIAASCAPNSIRVRPTGENSTFPPVLSTGNPSGYHITLALAPAATLEMDVVVTGILVDNVFSEYTRAVATITGRLVPAEGHQLGHAAEVLKGKALFDQVKMTA
ncbi:hypothetical protein B0H17DRAFT_981939 [Mycena rosella]|uniref:Hydroxyneurosporene synthase n=1 Tax=Mycena rosella TaxID=1033263 RepID=A0AAD7DJG3_MYCRO|nr:hypothetical protein B0H17DRAFT_981939 [Mycena rosella]